MKLVIENITKQIKGKVIISPFSTELTEGVYALLGPNGAGKTTLMRMLASISKPSSGRILLDGKDISLLDEITAISLVTYRKILVFIKPSTRSASYCTLQA
ncbi:ABC transporter ATP-binding protein [Bacillus sp. JCM 19046]|nr:ABC transporter ATP-binding protein [Bacillus sp. JCM 19046]